MHSLRILLKRPILWSLFLCFSICANAQNFEWAQQFGGLGLDTGREVTTDADGNVILVGAFSGSARIGGAFYSGYGSQEAFVAKLTPDGEVLWVNIISGSEEDLGRGAVTDSEGNVYVVGHFTDTVVFDITPTDTIGAGSKGGQDVFVVKYDSNGNYQWHLTGGGTGDDTATDIDWFPWSGKLYVCGGFQNRGTFGTSAILSNGLTDAFLMKMDGEGNVHWVRNGGGNDHDVAAAVAVDQTNEFIYIVGDFYEQADFDGTVLQSVGSSDMFLARFDEDGNQIWAQSNGGTNVDVATDIGVDLNNKVYVSGYYQLTTNFQGLSATALGYNDVFLTQFDVDGHCNWLTSAGSNALDNCLGMAVAWDGTTYITGMFNEEMFAGDVSFAGDGFDIFILCHNSDGSIRYGRKAGAGSSDFGMAACLGPDQSLYISGYYFFYSDFDNTTLDIADNGDGFIAKLTDIVSVEETHSTERENCIRLLSSQELQVDCAQTGTWELLNSLGQAVASGTFNNGRILTPTLETATYFIRITHGSKVWSAPFVAAN